MRIAVIGGGAAGLTAAWRLSRKHEVSLYEANSWLGGHARTVEVPGPGRTVPVDMGFLVFHEWIYTNFSALLAHLGVAAVPTPPQTTAVSFPGGAWKTGLATPFWSTVSEEADRFHRMLPSVVADPVRYAGLKLGDFLDGNGFSEDFKYKCVCPVGGSRFVTRRGVLELSVLEFAAGFGPVALYSIIQPTFWRTVGGGMREYIDRLAGEITGEVHPSTPVRSVQRSRGGITVTLAGGQVETFDQVVVATGADVALRLLADPSPEEKLLLGSSYQETRVVLHTDPSVMPDDRSLWAADTYVTHETAPPYQRGWVSYYLPDTQPWVDFDIFVTVGAPEGLIAPDRILEEHRWRHLEADSVQLLRSMELHRIQGKQRTWFCGEYAGMYGGHESSVVTGLAVAAALGADYPFTENAAAYRVFLDTAVNHMRVLDGPRPAADATWWPPVLGEVNARMIREIAREEVRGVLRQKLPSPLAALLDRLPWIEDTLVRQIAGRISLLEEAVRRQPEA